MSILRSILLIGCLVVAGNSSIVAADEVASRPPNAFRRVFVPANRMDVWPREGEKLVPIAAQEFDRWVQSANESPDTDQHLAVIARAEYSARIRDGKLRGVGRWTIDYRGQQPTILELGEMSLVLTEPHWLKPANTPARLGLWGNNGDSPSRYGLEVRKSDVLEFNWHINRSITRDQSELPWLAPVASTSQLTIDLPVGKVPLINEGVIVQSALLADIGKTPTDKFRRWVIALKPSHGCTLQITTAGGLSADVATPIAVSEETNYRCGSRGLDFEQTWRLQGSIGHLRRLSLAAPHGLQLSSIKFGAVDLAWHVHSGASSSSDDVIVELPEVVPQNARDITLTGWQPLTTGAPWTLPRIQSKGVFWTGGKIHLSIDSLYELQHLELSDCVEIASPSLSSGQNGVEQHFLTEYGPNAAIEILIAPRSAKPMVRAGTTLTLAKQELSGRLVSHWSLEQGINHHLVGQVSSNWIVENVEATPSDAISNWYLSQQGENRSIDIQLAHALSSNRSISIVVTGRLQGFRIGQPIAVDSLRMVAWKNADVTNHFVSFQSSEPYAILPEGDVPLVNRDKITGADHMLVDSSDNAPIYEIVNANKDAGLMLTHRRGQYSAESVLTISYANEFLTQDFDLVVTPAATSIDRVVIEFTSPLGVELQWFDKDSHSAIPSEKLIDTKLISQLPKGTEARLLRLAQPTSKRIELVATARSKMVGRRELPLLCLPEASSQNGRVDVRLGGQASLWLDRTGLQQILGSTPQSAAGSAEADRRKVKRFLYSPADCLKDVGRPQLIVSPLMPDQGNPLLAKFVDVESFFWPDGTGIHKETFALTDHGPTTVDINLHPGERIISASVDDRALDIVQSNVNPNSATIALPIQTTPSKLLLYFETHGTPLAAGAPLNPPLNLNGVRHLEGLWTIWLPPEFAIADGEGTCTSLNWKRRLFGILGRSDEVNAFTPSRLIDELSTSSVSSRSGASESQSTPSNNKRNEQELNRLSDSAFSVSSLHRTPPLGWRNFQKPFLVDEPSPATIAHQSAVSAWSFVMFVAVFLICRKLLFPMRRSIAFVLALAAVVALFTPTAFTDLAAGATLGVLATILFDRLQQPLSAAMVGLRPSSKTAIAIFLSLTAVIGIENWCQAQNMNDSIPAHVKTPGKAFRVFIPVDASGKRVGDKVYVSDDFLRQLTSGSSDHTPANRWLVRDGLLSGDLSGDRVASDSGRRKCRLTFNIETFNRDTTIRLPLIRDEADWRNTAMLDGIPLPITWNTNGAGCDVHIAEPGRYSLAIEFTPKETSTLGHTKFDLTLPQLPNNRIDVQLPVHAVGATESNAVVEPSGKNDQTSLAGELSFAPKVHIQWPILDVEHSTSDLSTSELSWLDVQPSQLDLTTKFIFEGTAQRPKLLELAYDDEWQLLNPKVATKSDNRNTISRKKRTVEIPVPAQPAERQELVLHWKFTGHTGFGITRLLPIEILSPGVSKRWLAISAAPSLQCDLLNSQLPSGSADEFVTKWGDSLPADQPQQVVTNFDKDIPFDLSIRPREELPVVDDVLNVAFGCDIFRTCYQAIITPNSYGMYRMDFVVPDHLHIDDLIAKEGDRLIPLRWSRVPGNHINIFFSEAINHKFQLVLNGRSEYAPGAKTGLPRMGPFAGDASVQKVQIYRDRGARVEISGLREPKDHSADHLESPPAGWDVQPVKACNLDAESASGVQISVTHNKTDFSSQSLTALTRDSGNWVANYHCQVKVSNGDLDELQLHIPDECGEPEDIQTSAPARSAFEVSAKERNLLLRPIASIAAGGNFDFRFRTRLTPSTTGPVSLPHIALQSSTVSKRFISLPDHTESKPIAWSINGIQPAKVPPTLLAGMPLSSDAQTFEVGRDDFHAASRTDGIKLTSPQIRLSDSSVVVGTPSDIRIATRFILIPNSSSRCIIKIPENQTLLTVRVDDRITDIRRIDSSSWEVSLGSEQLPEIIEIFTRLAIINSKRDKIERPQLVFHGTPIIAEVSLWSIGCVNESGTRIRVNAHEIPAVDQAELRFDRFMNVAESAISLAAEMPTADIQMWLKTWAKILANESNQVRLSANANNHEKIQKQVTQTSDEPLVQATARLQKWLDDCRTTFAIPSAEPFEFAADQRDLKSEPPFVASAASVWNYYVTKDGNDPLDIVVQSTAHTVDQHRLIGLIVIFAILCAVLWVGRQPAVLDVPYRWPQAVGTVLGIIFWAWLWPSWLGLVFIAICLFLTFRSGWPGAAIRTESSTVLRIPRTT